MRRVFAYKGMPAIEVTASPKSVNVKQPNVMLGPHVSIFLFPMTYNPEFT